MVCNNCKSDDLEMTRKQTDGQGYWEKEEYVCNNCGEEWSWEMTKTITKNGKEMEEE